MSRAMGSMLNVRIGLDTARLFKQKCSKECKPYTWVLRDLIEAYNDGRVTIQPMKEIKTK